MMQYIDTHTHIDGEEFNDDRAETIARAKAAGVSRMFVPAIDLKSVDTVLSVCRENEGYAYPMVGLHPEEVKADWREQLQQMRQMLDGQHPFIAIGEVGLDYYWSREFADEQLQAFEEQVRVGGDPSAAHDPLPQGTKRDGGCDAPLPGPVAGWCVPLLHRQPERGRRTVDVSAVCPWHWWRVNV